MRGYHRSPPTLTNLQSKDQDVLFSQPCSLCGVCEESRGIFHCQVMAPFTSSLIVGDSFKNCGVVALAVLVSTVQQHESAMCVSISRSVVPDSLRPHGLYPSQASVPMELSRQEHWSGWPFPSPKSAICIHTSPPSCASLQPSHPTPLGHHRALS